MVLLEDRLDSFRDTLDHIVANASHLLLVRDLLVLGIELHVQLLFVLTWSLRLSLLLVDLHLAVVVVDFDVLFDYATEILHRCLHILAQLQVKVWPELVEFDRATLRFSVGLFELHLNVVLNDVAQTL